MHVEITRVQFNVQYVNVVNRKCCFALYFFLDGLGVALATPWLRLWNGETPESILLGESRFTALCQT